jgi:hypothetical protein
VQDVGPRGCHAAAGAGAITEEHGCTGGKPELSMGAVAMFTGREVDPDPGNDQPGQEPKEVPANLLSARNLANLNQWEPTQEGRILGGVLCLRRVQR